MLGGVLDRFPNLRVYITHAGGYIPYQIERIAMLDQTLAPDAVNERPPLEYLRNFWFDPMIPNDGMRRALVDLVGIDRVVYGSNMGGSDQITFDLTDRIGLSEAEREQIKSKNAIELLNLGGRVDLGQKVEAHAHGTDAALSCKGKVAIVTGAGDPEGIGCVTAQTLAEAGAQVVLADLPGTQLEAAAARAGEAGTVAHHPVDISDESAVKALVAFTVERFGRLDIVDNNAAAVAANPFDDSLVTELEVDLWDSGVLGQRPRHDADVQARDPASGARRGRLDHQHHVGFLRRR